MVDRHHPGLDRGGDRIGRPGRARESTGGKAIGQAVLLGRGILEAAEGRDQRDRPKGSSFMIRASFGTLVRTVGSKKFPLLPMRWPPVRTRAPRSTASPISAPIAGDPAPIGQGTHLSAAFQPVGDLGRMERLGEFIDEGFMDLLLHQERVGEVQAWPALRSLAPVSRRLATSTSASSNTMVGAWPPSSMVTRFICALASAAKCLPITVEPVKETLLMTGCGIGYSEISLGLP
jgi:hypothetical protein